MKCDRCDTEIHGGFNPTGFIFPPCTDCFKPEPKYNICRPCYELFWKRFIKIEIDFIENFFDKKESTPKIALGRHDFPISNKSTKYPEG